MGSAIDGSTARRLRRHAIRGRRPLSAVVEIAVERLLGEKAPASDHIVTSRGSFRGTFSREETYEDR